MTKRNEVFQKSSKGDLRNRRDSQRFHLFNSCRSFSASSHIQIKSTLVMRPDISYLDQVTEEAEEDLIGMEEEKPKPKSKTLTEVRVEYTKRRNDENHFGPLTYAELSSVQNEEPWVVRLRAASEV